MESMFSIAAPTTSRTPEELKAAFDDAVKTHPFFDSSHFIVNIADDAVFRDGKGQIAGILVRNGIPQAAATAAAKVLMPAATRTSLRANIFGGEAPMSGIAGYYDYMGSPVELKCRKTSFTCEVINQWKEVFPLVDYASAIYKAACPAAWQAQSAAIPEPVRIHGSPFSTLTINQRFRTAKHTDAGDFDAGFGLLTVLEGDYDGLDLGLTDFKVCFTMRPRDVLIFNTHLFHCNTELQRRLCGAEDWSRLTCVFYYRVALGEQFCVQQYQRRLREAPAGSTTFTEVVAKDNGENSNRPSAVFAAKLTPFNVASTLFKCRNAGDALQVLHNYVVNNPTAAFAWFGVDLSSPNGLPRRRSSELKDSAPTASLARVSSLGGFSEATVDKALNYHTLLSEESLARTLTDELHKMWKESRGDWLKLVSRDWKAMIERNGDRSDFSWKNKSDMNSRFFDLCDVAEQVMLHVLGKEAATPAQASSFWACFASHLHISCRDELKMPAEAMSMKKLNVKLKDYTFGGTRYFSDMPKEEQERRLLRKKRIEEARRGNANAAEEAAVANWLENDAFDYQSEQYVVDYSNKVTPSANATAIVGPLAVAPVLLPAKTQCKVRVLLIVPIQCKDGDDEKKDAPDSPLEREEHMRITRYVFAPQQSEPNALPAEIEVSENVTLVVWAYNFVSEQPPTPFDVVIVRDVASHLPNEAVGPFFATLRKFSPRDDFVLLLDTDLDDRSHYLLTDERFAAYNKVRQAAFRSQHEARSSALTYGGGRERPDHLRGSLALRHLLETSGVSVLSSFSFDGAPLNTVCLTCKL